MSERAVSEDGRQRAPSPDNRPSLELTRTAEAREEYESKHADEPPAQSQQADQKDPEIQTVDWDGPRDPHRPFNWSKSRKLLMTTVALISTFLVQINGTSITVAAADINTAFGISDASFPNSYWPVTSWTLGGAVFTMIILPLMEDLGLRISYLVRSSTATSLTHRRIVPLTVLPRSPMLFSSSSSYHRPWLRTLPPR